MAWLKLYSCDKSDVCETLNLNVSDIFTQEVVSEIINWKHKGVEKASCILIFVANYISFLIITAIL